MTPDEEHARLEKIAADHVGQLMEHFDTVEIICTKALKLGETGTISNGDGNYFARWGSVRNWVIRQDEQARDSARQREL